MTVVRTEGTALPGSADWAESFAAICDSHRSRLVRWLTSIFGPRDAEDIAQEALTRLYQRPDLLAGDSDAWPWLSVVARNVGRDMARHNAFATAVDAETFERLADGAHVHEEVVARDDAARLAVAMGRLTPRDRALIRLRDIDGVGIADIADTLGTNENAARQQLFRARRRLASAYTALGGDRRAGITAVIGLRFREFMRRHGHLVHALSGPSSALASALPSVAIVVGGALFGGFAAAGEVPSRAVAYGAAHTGIEPPHGVASRHGRPLSPRAPSPRPQPQPDPPIFDLEHRTGDVSVKGKVNNTVLDEEGGRTDYFQVHIDNVPIVGEVNIEMWGDQDPGNGPVCSRIDCTP